MGSCFHCGGTVIWDSDFMASEYGYEREGLVHALHCADCGAEIQYIIYDEEEEDEQAEG